MKNFARHYAVILCLLLIAYGCSTKKKGGQVVGVVGTDTLTQAMIETLRPDSLPDSIRAEKVAIQRVLGSECHLSLSGGKRDTLVGDLMKQLSLRSGGEWNREATAGLFEAACGLKALLDTARSMERVSAYLDSVFRFKVKLAGGGTEIKPVEVIPQSLRDCSRSGAFINEMLDTMLSCVLGVSPQVGKILADFVFSTEQATSDSASMLAMVQGLVYDASAVKTRKTAVMQENIDKSEQVLKFRNQISIQDSIARHQVNIRELYKKQLKKNSLLAGKVVVEFRVDPEGKVIAAAIAKSQISDREFLEPLLHYAQGIRFKPVPANAGNMTFQFPFEFSPEE
jgi:TonB family protein